MKTIDALRTAEASYPENDMTTRYKNIMINMLHFNFPLLTEDELASAVDYSISKHFKDKEVRIENNYLKIETTETLSHLVDYIAIKEPIFTSAGVMFSKHGDDKRNPIYALIQGFIDARKAAKKEMFKYPKGSENFEKYNLRQLLDKIDCNGFYGVCGQYSSMFYNIHVASAITAQGQSAISAAALFFENFLANNVPMASMEEVIEFIYNVINEKRYYKNYEIITNHASIEETFFQILHSTGFGWIPTNEEMNIIWEILEKLNQDDLDRIFYKNNLYNFIDNPPVKNIILYILQLLREPFMDPNTPPEEIKKEINEFRDILKEFVYYDKQIVNRVAKMKSLIRKVSIIQDTDSAIVCYDGLYRYVRNMCAGIPMRIKTMVTDVDTEESYESDLKVNDIDPNNPDVYDEEMEADRAVDPMKIVPQDGLRYSIINVFAYCMSSLVNSYMESYCRNANTDKNNSNPCLMSLKTEFLFKRLLVTDGKKHYASKIEVQEGHIVPEEKSLDIKGMDAFVKSTSNPITQEHLKKILYDDILNSEQIDIVKILKDIHKVEQEIFDSINAGEKKYYKPAQVKSISSYENPMRIQGIVASYAYNALHEEGTEAFDLTTRNPVDIIKVDMNVKNIDKIKDSFPKVYQKALALLNTPEYEDGIDSIAIPINEPVPKWVIPFVSVAEIVNDSVKGFPIESIGVLRGGDTNNTTNIIHF